MGYDEIVTRLHECGITDPHQAEALLYSETYRGFAIMAIRCLASTDYMPSKRALEAMRSLASTSGLGKAGITENSAMHLLADYGDLPGNLGFFNVNISSAGARGVSLIMRWLAAC
jgi:hypothetical protein